MSNTILQAFRTRSNPNITLSSHYDPKSNRYVVLWVDIQRYFEGARSLMDGTEVVLFLKDANLEDLIPLRIARRPNVLDVIISAKSHLSDHSTDGSSDNTRGNSAQPSVDSTEQSADGGTNRLPLEMNIIMTQQEELCRLRQHVQQMQQQLDEVHKLAQPALQEVQDPSQQQMQHQLNQIPEEVHGLYQHKEKMDEVLQKIQRMDQELQGSQEHFQKHMEETLQMTQQLDVTLQEIRKTNQKVLDSHSELQLQLGELLRRTEPLDQQTRSSREQTQPLQQPLQRQTDENQTLQHGYQQEQLNQQSQESLPGLSEDQKVEDQSPSMLQTGRQRPKPQEQTG
ncbi:MAG: hypothetical protein J3Q66DRAFT_389195, partial [Benniella sp.]